MRVDLICHVPKTGGQTLRNHLIRQMVFHETFIHLGPYGRLEEERMGLAPFLARSPEERAKARVVMGHWVNLRTHEALPGAEPVYWIALRDPVKRLISHYNFEAEYFMRQQGKPVQPFAAWYADKRDSQLGFVAREIGGHDLTGRSGEAVYELALATMEKIDHVCLTEELDRCLAPLLKTLGLPTAMERANVCGAHHPPTLVPDEELLARLYAENALDVAFYETCTGRRIVQERAHA